MKTSLTEIRTTDMVQYINETLPTIIEKAHFFRTNSQHSLSFQTITMLNGQHPMRMLRQIAAEISGKRDALLEAAQNAEKTKRKLAKASGVNKMVLEHQFVELQNAVQNAMKDVCVLTERYNQIEEKNGIRDWTEEDFENAEASFHIRRGFELLYQNLIQLGRPEKSIIEYLQQYGVHPQVATREVSGYMALVEKAIEDGERPDASHLEDFLDAMMKKYEDKPKDVSERIFGTRALVLTKSIIPTIEGNGNMNRIGVDNDTNI